MTNHIKTSFKLLCIGEAMAELKRVPDQDWSLGFAGDTFNTAVYASRLMRRPGAVGFMSRVGEDPLSSDFRSFVKAEGLPQELIGTDTNRNIGIYSVSTDFRGERSFHYWRSNSAARTMFATPEEAADIPPAEVIYVSGISIAILAPAARANLAAEVARRRATDGTRFAFDSNYRPHLWEDTETARQSFEVFWRLADVALPSIDDEVELYGHQEAQTVEQFTQRMHLRVAIKRAARGPLDPTLGDRHPNFSPADHIVDTTAAGDSFNAGYLAAYVMGKESAECMALGHALASRVVCARGAIMPISEMQDLAV